MTADELEDQLRLVFSRSAAGIDVPAQARERLLGRNYHPRKVSRGKVASIAAVVAVTGILVPLAAGAGSTRGAASSTIALASYKFQMPADYKRTVPTSAACPVPVITGSAAWGKVKGPVGQASDGTTIQAAASSSGACLSLVLEPAYTPTNGAPDPEAPPGAQPVQVGSYHGVIFKTDGLVYRGGKAPEATWELLVELPAGDSEMRDLAVAEAGLSASALIGVVTHGLQQP